MGGIVYLVGAGPGDPGLLTLRGRECIEAADVIVYDRLVAAELLALARPDAETVYAGKGRGQAMTQEGINALLVGLAAAGRVVCRLKGGDPFVFGRGGEEAEALVRAGLPFEVVPGVTSAIAAAAYAGIPITHRGVSSHFAVVTGHESPGKERSEPDWQALARMDTVVFLMAMKNLPRIRDRFIAAGKRPETPAAAVHWGTWPGQRTVTGTLADLPERVAAAGIGAPSAVVVGETVALRERIAWLEHRPLAGRRLLVPTVAGTPCAIAGRLSRLGAMGDKTC